MGCSTTASIRASSVGPLRQADGRSDDAVGLALGGSASSRRENTGRPAALCSTCSTRDAPRCQRRTYAASFGSARRSGRHLDCRAQGRTNLLRLTDEILAQAPSPDRQKSSGNRFTVPSCETTQARAGPMHRCGPSPAGSGPTTLDGADHAVVLQPHRRLAILLLAAVRLCSSLCSPGRSRLMELCRRSSDAAGQFVHDTLPRAPAKLPAERRDLGRCGSGHSSSCRR